MANNLIDVMFKRLTDETDLSGEDLLDEALPADKSISARHQIRNFGYRDGQRYFTKYPRQRILMGLFNYSVDSEQYQIGYRVLKGFMPDLVKTRDRCLMLKLKDKFWDTTRYEAKIMLVLQAMSLITRQEAFDLMKVVINVLDEPANNSYLRNNINPLRVSLMLYRMIAETT